MLTRQDDARMARTNLEGALHPARGPHPVPRLVLISNKKSYDLKPDINLQATKLFATSTTKATHLSFVGDVAKSLVVTNYP